MPRNMGRTRRLSLYLLTVSVGLAGALGVGEIVIRTALSDSILLFPRYHTDARYGEYVLRRLRPSSAFWHTSVDGSWEFRTNAQGFRSDRDFLKEKPTGVVRVLVLGDSHTLGFEVRQDYTYSAVLERALAQRGRAAEVMNTGISGFSTAEELAFLEHEGIQYQPDYVVVGFYANDYQDNLRSGLFVVEGDELISKSTVYIPGVGIQNAIYALPIVKWLGENSYLYSLVFNATWELFKRISIKDASETSGIDPSERAIGPSQHNDYEIDLAAKIIERMEQVSRRHEARLILVDIPVLDALAQRESVADGLRDRISHLPISLMRSHGYLGPYVGVAELNVPNGQRHISEFTHTVLGVAVAEEILRIESEIGVSTELSSLN